MIERGEIAPVHAAIFADVGNEPRAVYEYLDYIDERTSFPIHRVSAGNLGDDMIAALAGERSRCATPPFAVLSAKDRAAGNPPGKLWRQCTRDYKIVPILRKVRELMKEAGVKSAVQLIGISTDEAHRMKPPRQKYLANEYPLIERLMSRRECLKWMESNGYQTPPKSACYFCPYMSDARAREIRDTDPESWAKAVAFDRSLRNTRKTGDAAIHGEIFVHRSGRPLEEAIDDSSHPSLDLFGEECEGMCGL